MPSNWLPFQNDIVPSAGTVPPFARLLPAPPERRDDCPPPPELLDWVVALKLTATVLATGLAGWFRVVVEADCA
ncbi:MAG: hypothetical protein QM750_21545 [Rubrivivax sp.]